MVKRIDSETASCWYGGTSGTRIHIMGGDMNPLPRTFPAAQAPSRDSTPPQSETLPTGAAAADQDLLLVVSEMSDVVLVAADPDNHRALGRSKAIHVQQSNHPLVPHSNLFV